MEKKPFLAYIPLLISLAAAAALTAYALPDRAGLAGLLGALGLASFIWGTAACAAYRRKVMRSMNEIFRENDTTAGNIIHNIDIPCLLFDSRGEIVWTNDAFDTIYSGSDIGRLEAGIDPEKPVASMMFEHNGRTFQLFNMPVVRINSERPLTFQYWQDKTEAIHYSRLYEEQMPTVCIIQVDNFDDLMTDKQFHRNTVLSEVERRISDVVTELDGVYRRYDNSKFFVVFEAKRIAELEQQRFALLDSVHGIDTGTGQPVTLSISVGVANRILQSDEAARNALQLALGRGGDQAVVKRGNSFTFYGGKRSVTTQNSRVKTRLFAEALRHLLEAADNVFIMGHRMPDMDCVGAAVGLMRCARSVNCAPYFVLDENNPTIEGAIDIMQSNPLFRDCIRTPEQAQGLMRSSSVLIIVDTQRLSSIMAPHLIDHAGKVVVIDHHRRSVDAVQNATLNFLEAGASSVCEMVTEVIQYFDDNIRPTAFECGAMLAGITMDTKHFSFNTGARTFEAASYLRRHGADNATVKMMFQDDMQTYRDRAKVVEGAFLMEKGIAISACPDNVENPTLIAAQAADELITIKGIQAAFVLSKREQTIYISGRSLGNISVQLILEKLGGGGHQSVAGAQLHSCDLDHAINRLTESIKHYLKEAAEQK